MGLETQSKHEPPINVGTEILRSDGYCVIGDVAVTPDHYDAQGHLNNAAIGRLFNDMRISYILETVGMWWGRYFAYAKVGGRGSRITHSLRIRRLAW